MSMYYFGIYHIIGLQIRHHFQQQPTRTTIHINPTSPSTTTAATTTAATTTAATTITTTTTTTTSSTKIYQGKNSLYTFCQFFNIFLHLFYLCSTVICKRFELESHGWAQISGYVLRNIDLLYFFILHTFIVMVKATVQFLPFN